MGVDMAAERRLLSQDEYDPVARSHYPALGDLPREDLASLARWLRERRARARDIVRGHRRVRRGKAEPRAAGAEPPSERGLSAKKQVFARALRRANSRIERLRAEDKRSRDTRRLREALERKRTAPVHHPEPGRTACEGMRPIDNDSRTTTVDPRQVGSVSQAVRDAQARRDG